MHLFRWEILDCSKELGVWALKNIFHFSKSLLAKIQWLSFFRNSPWNNVLKIKYLKSCIFLKIPLIRVDVFGFPPKKITIDLKTSYGYTNNFR